MKFEVVEIKTGARMAYTKSGEMMSTTLFDTQAEAVKWMNWKVLTASTHEVRPAK